MKVNGANLSMIRGDSESFSARVTGYELKDGDYMEFTVRKRYNAPVSIYKKLEFADLLDGKFIFSILPEDTEKLSVGEYVYDLQLTFGGAVKTPVKGTFTIEDEVTYGTRN